MSCFDHDSFSGGLKCTNGVCGDVNYFNAFSSMQCEEDDLCQVSKFIWFHNLTKALGLTAWKRVLF